MKRSTTLTRVSSTRSQRTRHVFTCVLLLAAIGVLAHARSAFGSPVPQNLGAGLRDLVEQQVSATSRRMPNNASPRPIISYDDLKISDSQQRVLVNIVLNGEMPLANVQNEVTALGAIVTATSNQYRAGVLEAFVSPTKAAEIAKWKGVSAIHLVPKPLNNIGKATTQGIMQHRIGKVPAGTTGAGITIGVLSDSYNLFASYGAPITAESDIASGDLPGPGNPLGHTQAVVLFEEGPSGSDEGRAMLQIVHDIGPDARLGFATATSGEVEFADRIRSLAGLPSGSLSKPDFKADVIIDDVIYLDEPMFQDGIVAQAVDETSDAGVAYFAAAGNQAGSQAYESPVRLVPASPAAVAGTNLDLSGVDPALFRGGFHNYRSGAGQDIAQKVHIGGDGIIVFQWNEPFDAMSGSPGVQSDFNLLFFDTNGAFVGAVAENNVDTNRPIEIGQVFGTRDLQMVIARGNEPPQGARIADRLRYVWFHGGQPQEYTSYNTPATYGHSCAAGASGVSAYAFYPPFIPEGFTSPGPATIYFDANGHPLQEPETRLKPDFAAMDGANTTFFFDDVSQDKDGLPNFFGTSAAAPHAGGIAALMLQSAGGPRSLQPDTLREVMQQSTFAHDLDPNHSEGLAQLGGVRNGGWDRVLLSADGDRSLRSSRDPSFFTVRYLGGNSVSSFTLNLADADTTERPRQGLVCDLNEGVGFPFTLGHNEGVPHSAITAAFAAPAPAPAEPNRYGELTLSIAPGAMSGGDVIRFGVDRDEVDAFGPLGAVGGNSADLLGAGVLIPEGTIAQGGATFSATLSDGTKLDGVFENAIGHGYSPLDGFGFVNAQAAVEAVQKPSMQKQ